MKLRRLFLSIAFAVTLFEGNGIQAQDVAVTLNVATAGTLNTFIDSTQKNQITDLTLTGNLNAKDILYIREMAGRDLHGNPTSGILSVLDLSGANIVRYGGYYYSSSFNYFTSANVISDYMFNKCTTLTSITLPNNVTTIGPDAFYGCTGLTSITIPNSVTSIKSSAFYGCTKLTSVTIPNSVTSLGSTTFGGCTELIQIIVDSTNVQFCSVDGVLFSKDKTVLITYPNGKSPHYIMPDSAISIGQYAFNECTGLTSITIGNNVTSIGQCAFWGCTGLTSIIIPNSVTSIGQSAFIECTGLTSIIIPNSVTSIGYRAFWGCTGLTSITIPKSVTTIDQYAFYGCTGLTSIIIPKSVTSIGDQAFNGCTGLTSAIIGNSVTTIYDEAFLGCTKLTSVILGKGVTSIRAWAFQECSGLTEIHCKMTTPPIIPGNLFMDATKTACKLYVPAGCSALYKVAGWGDFMTIMEETPPQWNGTAWSSSTPTSVDDATINGPYNGAGFSCNNLKINAGKQVTITSGALTVDGNLTLMSDTTGTATFVENGGTLNVADTTRVEQYVTGGASPIWYFSSPLSAAYSDVITESSLVGQLWSHSESEGTDQSTRWTSVPSATKLNPMQGYLARMGGSGVVTFTGGSLNTGTITLSGLTRTVTSGDQRGFNLVGNPYPSYLDWNQATKSKVRSTIWLPTCQSDGKTIIYDTFDGITGTGNGVNGVVTKYIPPMQAFWVQVDEDNTTDGSITFTNAMRSHQNVDLSPDTLATQRQLLRLQVSNGMFHDEAIVFFDPNASDDFDPYDSPKLSNDVDSVPEIYTLAGDEQMVINGLNNADMNKDFALGFKTGKSGTFTLKATEISKLKGVNILLMDNQLNTVTDLTSGNTYTFKSDSTNTTDRFSVSTAKIVTGLNFHETPSVSVYSSAAGQIAITIHGKADEDCKVSVYSILGQRLLDNSITGERTVLNKNFTTGVYLVSVNIGGEKVNKKVSVK